METIQTKLIEAGVAFLIMLVSGIVLSRKGKPYHKGVFTIHKLATLLTLFLMVRAALPYLKGEEFKTGFISVVILTGVITLVAFISGVLLSFEKPMPEWLTKLHRVGSLLFVVSILAFVFFVIR